jgi:hypothetical protein
MVSQRTGIAFPLNFGMGLGRLLLCASLAAAVVVAPAARAEDVLDEPDTAADVDAAPSGAQTSAVETLEEPEDLRTPPPQVRRSTTGPVRAADDGLGVGGRLGHIAFPTFGRNHSLSHVELFPYVMADDEMLFGDFRLFIDNMGRLGGNGGLGFRHWVSAWEAALGGSAWYDADDTTGEFFQQLGYSFEAYTRYLDGRANFYFPIGHDDRDFGVRAVNPRFVGHQILFDRRQEFGEALKGLDLELGVLLPTEFSARHELRAYGGWYHFPGDHVDDIDGFKVRMEGYVTEAISTQVQVTKDDTFGTNVTLGVAVEFSGGPPPGDVRSAMDLKARLMRRFVERNYNVIVSRGVTFDRNLTAVNPATGQPYVVQHVNSTSGGGSGTAGDPFATIAAAQAAGGDIVFVQAGSVFNTAVVLNPNERILGEGADHWIAVPNYGQLLLPRTGASDNRPLLQAVAGDAVTLSAGSEFSGFVIDSPTGHGIVGTTVDHALVGDVTISGAGGDGIFIQNGNGSVRFANVHIANAAGAGLNINGGAPEVLFGGSILNPAGYALQVENTTGGSVDLTGASISSTGGQGIRIANAAGNVTLGDTAILNSTLAGIEVAGGTGNVRFNGTTTVQQSAAAGIDIQNTAGTVAFANANVTADGQTALFTRNAARVAIEGGSLAAINTGAAADIEDTEMAIALTSVSSDGGPFGVRIVDSPGSFVVYGNGTLGSGGVIQNATTGAVLQNSGTVAFQYVDFDANGTAVQANDLERLVLARNRVLNSTGTGVDLTSVRNLEVSNTTFSGNAGTSLLVRADAAGSYSYLIVDNLVNETGTVAVDLATTGAGAGSSLSLDFSGNRVNTTAASATGVLLNWNGVVVADFANNQFAQTGASSTGIDVTAASATDLAKLIFTENEFDFDGATSTGLRVTTSGASQIAAVGNNVVFDAASGIGMDFSLAPSATVALYDNRITDNVSSGTGILFRSVAATSNILLEKNVVNLLSNDAFVDRGIIFQTVTGTINLTGTQSNTVTGATTPFFAPAGSTSGTIIVNGAPVP